jgi:DNA replication protein DnaC
MTARRGKVDLDATRAQLEQAGLAHAAARLAELVEDAARDELSSHRFLDRLLAVELGERDERRIKTSLRLSGLPPGQTLGNFDFAFQPSVEKSRIETLATCAWIREHATTLIAGPPGTGKSHLAVALGVKAIENGFSVAFYRLDDLLAAMRRDIELAPQRLRRKKYNNVSLLIIDSCGVPGYVELARRNSGRRRNLGSPTPHNSGRSGSRSDQRASSHSRIEASERHPPRAGSVSATG